MSLTLIGWTVLRRVLPDAPQPMVKRAASLA